MTQLEYAQKKSFGPFHLSFFLLSGLISQLGANDRAAAAAAAAAGDCKNGGGGGGGYSCQIWPQKSFPAIPSYYINEKNPVFITETLQNVWQHLSNGRCGLVKSILDIANSQNFRN